MSSGVTLESKKKSSLAGGGQNNPCFWSKCLTKPFLGWMARIESTLENTKLTELSAVLPHPWATKTVNTDSNKLFQKWLPVWMHLLDFLWLDVFWFFLVYFLPLKKRFIPTAHYSKVNPPFNLTGVVMQGPGCGDANLSSLEWIDIKVCPGDNERQTPWTFPQIWHILPKHIHVGR